LPHECTAPLKDGEELSSRLFASWKTWCEENGEKPGSNKTFSRCLRDLGVASEHDRRGTVFAGLKVLTAP
jgi:phage/plasmid-associated DNA primase